MYSAPGTVYHRQSVCDAIHFLSLQRKNLEGKCMLSCTTEQMQLLVVCGITIAILQMWNYADRMRKEYERACMDIGSELCVVYFGFFMHPIPFLLSLAAVWLCAWYMERWLMYDGVYTDCHDNLLYATCKLITSISHWCHQHLMQQRAKQSTKIIKWWEDDDGEQNIRVQRATRKKLTYGPVFYNGSHIYSALTSFQAHFTSICLRSSTLLYTTIVLLEQKLQFTFSSLRLS